MLRRLALLVLLAIPGRSWSAECPTTRCDLYHGFVTFASRPAGNVGLNEPSGYSRMDVSWNAPLGDLALVGTLLSSPAFPAGEVATTDDFEILGAPPGVPVSVTVRLEGSGSNISVGVGSASFSGSLADAAGRIVTAGPEPPNVLRLALPVDFVAGSPQRITYRLSGYGIFLPVSAEARLRFDDLPAGMSIVSCRGFQSGAVTASKRGSWASLKKLYR